jgi:hypothetical protein
MKNPYNKNYKTTRTKLKKTLEDGKTLMFMNQQN